MKRHTTTRRTFLKAAAVTPLAAPMARAHWQGERPAVPSDRISFAVFGMGGQGTSDASAALRVPDTELVAVADAYDGRLERAREVYGRDLFLTRDYREILARRDVDAVVIATPDHWHARMTIDALEAGKDVYCEKPMVHTLQEGRQVVEAEKRTGRILQVGSQRVSSLTYLKARDLLAAGAIGELNLVEAFWNRNSAIGAWQYSIPPDTSPENTDWDRFLGHAPRRPFDPVRFFRWRNYWDYGTGVAGDLFVHLFSGLHLVTGTLGPSRIQAIGALRFWKDGRDAPDVMAGLYKYPGWDLTVRVNFADGGALQQETSGFRFSGSEGVLTIGDRVVTVSRAPRPKDPGYTIWTFSKAVQDRFLKEYREQYPDSGADSIRDERDERYLAPRNYNDTVDHFRNFFTSMRSRQPVVEDAAFGLRAAAPSLLTNEAYLEEKIVRWNPESMKVE